MNKAQMRDTIERLTRQRDELSENGCLAMAMLDVAHSEHIILFQAVRAILAKEDLCSCCKIDALWDLIDHEGAVRCPDCRDEA